MGNTQKEPYIREMMAEQVKQTLVCNFVCLAIGTLLPKIQRVFEITVGTHAFFDMIYP